MLAGAVKRVFTSGPAGPAGATLVAALSDISAAMKAVLTAPSLSAARTAFGLAIGSSVQAWSATLDALAGLATTAFGRSLLTQADAPTALGTLGAVPATRQVATAAAGGLQGGGPLSTDLSLAIVAGGVTNAMLAMAPAYTLKANLLASVTNPADVGLSALIDAMFGNTRGALLARSASGWGLLAPGTIGQYLGTGGSGADVSWGTPQGAGNISSSGNPAAGQLALFASGTSIQGMAPPVLGQCRFVYSSTTACLLNPQDGGLLFIAGKLCAIPSGGVTLANTALTAATRYYVYAFMNGATMTLEAVSTAPAVDASYGHKIKSGDGSRTLVGMVYMAGSSGTGTFSDTATFRGVYSHFNRRSIVLRQSVPGATASGSYAGVSSGTMVFLCWGDEAVSVSIFGSVSNSAAGTPSTINVLDGSQYGQSSNAGTTTAGAALPVAAVGEAAAGDLSENSHSLIAAGSTNAGTATWSATQFVRTRG